jgi:hypothetical protein
MVDGLHILTWNRTKKPLVIALSGTRRGLKSREEEGNVNNVQYKTNQNCHYESPQMYIKKTSLYKIFILIKTFKNVKKEIKEV